jgi:hypothetical protein
MPYGLLVCDTKLPVFWRNLLSPFSGQNNPDIGPCGLTCHLSFILPLILLSVDGALHSS